jgi:hypothetical protein
MVGHAFCLRKCTNNFHEIEQQQSFEDLKHRLCSYPLLFLPHLQQSFHIDIDASDYVVGVFSLSMAIQ